MLLSKQAAAGAASILHFLTSLYIEKAARNTGTQHLIFWTKKSKLCWVVLDHHHCKKNLSTYYLQTFISSRFLQIMIEHLWKTKRLWNQVVSFSAQNPSNMCGGWE